MTEFHLKDLTHIDRLTASPLSKGVIVVRNDFKFPLPTPNYFKYIKPNDKIMSETPKPKLNIKVPVAASGIVAIVIYVLCQSGLIHFGT